MYIYIYATFFFHPHLAQPWVWKFVALFIGPGFKVAGVRYVGPSRQQLAAAEADQRQLEAARAAGADMEAVSKQLFASMEVDARAARVEECIEKCKDSFRARFKKQGHTYFGPLRTVRAEALEDAQTLLAAADISIPALQAAETRLKEESGLPEMSLEKAVLEAMSYWLRQGSTSEMDRSFQGTEDANASCDKGFRTRCALRCGKAASEGASGDGAFCSASFCGMVVGERGASEAGLRQSPS